MIKMSWKQILKIDIDEARRLGDKYAPNEMEEDRRDKDNKKMEENKMVLRHVLRRMKKTEKTSPDLERGFRHTLQLALREMPNPPRISGKNLDQMISMVEDYLEGKQTTNLIDRAKRANEEDPRMGSGRETKKADGPVSSKTSGIHRVSYSQRDKDDKDE